MENVYLEVMMQNNNSNRRKQLSNNKWERSEYQEIDEERTKTDEIWECLPGKCDVEQRQQSERATEQ